jgi:hypothetical protein
LGSNDLPDDFVFLLLAILKKITAINIMGVLPGKYYILPIIGVWLSLLFRYYTKDKAVAILEKFEKKALKERRA